MMFGFAMLIGLVLTGAIVLGLLWSVATYNGLAAARSEYADAFGWMLERLRQRNGLLPSLVETARPFMRHEREILEAVQIAAQQQEALSKELASAKVDPAAVEKLREAIAITICNLPLLCSTHQLLRACATQQQRR